MSNTRDDKLVYSLIFVIALFVFSSIVTIEILSFNVSAPKIIQNGGFKYDDKVYLVTPASPGIHEFDGKILKIESLENNRK